MFLPLVLGDLVGVFDDHRAEHAGVHVVEQVAVERPLADGVDLGFGVDGGAGRDADHVLDRVPLAAAIDISGVVVLFCIDKGVPAATVTVVTVPAPISLLKLAADLAVIVLSELNLGKVIAEGLVNVNID